MWAVALQNLRDPEDAADALQDAFLSAFRSAGSFQGHAQVTTWLHRIVVNACVDRIRWQRSRPALPLPEAGPEDPAIVQDVISDRDTRFAVEAALRALPAEQRAAIILVDLEGYSVAETALLLAVAEGTVKSRCARGRAQLAVLLSELRSRAGVRGR